MIALTNYMRASHLLALVLVVFALFTAAVCAAMNVTFKSEACHPLIFAGLALSVDILLGYTGLLSLGQALYFGLGAYISALTLMQVPSFWAALLMAIVSGLVLALVGGFIALRVRGVYFALITFGMAQVVAKVIYNKRALVASDGMTGVPIINVNLGITPISSAPGQPFVIESRPTLCIAGLAFC